MTRRFAILGSGAWGTAVALLLAERGHAVSMFCARDSSASQLKVHRERKDLLPGIRIPECIEVSASPEESVNGSDYWISAVPTAYLRTTMSRFRNLPSPMGIISLTKGLEVGTFQRPSEILAEFFPGVSLAVLSGPSHAEEVARGLPTSVVVASDDLSMAQSIQQLMGSERFRIYSSNDMIGVELAGALKNVVAIAAGVSDGLGFGDNAKSALVTRGLVEMIRFGVSHGAAPETFHGMAGMADLMATCFSPHGRNRRAGERIAKGTPVCDVVHGPQVVEGYFTAKSAFDRYSAIGLDMPILRAVYRVLYEAQSPEQAVRELMTRRFKPEGIG